jgi:hypothetical protein
MATKSWQEHNLKLVPKTHTMNRRLRPSIWRNGPGNCCSSVDLFEDRSVPYSEREHDIPGRCNDASVNGDVNALDTKEPTKPTLLWT